MKRIRENRTDLSIPGNRVGYDEPDHRLKRAPHGAKPPVETVWSLAVIAR